ncbi:MAG: fibronectin type III [Olpidium bornovanus]|uniref:Fibronectin type III n=1 Tax=Olpidium bornovanus TaxID=278681 RepID=A0A8H7ZNB7_9FUNG|nr:MAG: fibronectin type III [Olpidium bornovanus]
MLSPAKVRVSVVPPEENGGSEITSYKIVCTPVNEAGEAAAAAQTVHELVPAPGTQPTIVVDGLTPGTNYVVRAVAVNSAGESAIGAPSEIVTLGRVSTRSGALTSSALVNPPAGSVLPVPDPPKAETTEDGIRITFSPPANLDEKTLGIIQGRELLYARDEKSILNITNIIATRLPLDVAAYEVKNLKPGRSYWFAVAYVGSGESGVCSAAVKCRAPLDEPAQGGGDHPPGSEAAAALQRTDRSKSFSSVSSGRLSRAGSHLSFNQKILNMHHGVPSQHVPPELMDAGAEQEQAAAEPGPPPAPARGEQRAQSQQPAQPPPASQQQQQQQQQQQRGGAQAEPRRSVKKESSLYSLDKAPGAAAPGPLPVQTPPARRQRSVFVSR